MKKRTITAYCSRLFDYKNQVPLITIQGKWLKELGFVPGDTIEILNGGANMLILIKNGNKYLDKK
jgi:HSP20-like domain of unknown function (DUF1813).